MNKSELIDMIDASWPSLDRQLDWRELSADKNDALVMACSAILSSEYAKQHATLIMNAAYALLTAEHADYFIVPTHPDLSFT